MMGVCEWLLQLVCVHNTGGDDDGGIAVNHFQSCI